MAAWAVALGILTILLAGATARAETTGGTEAPAPQEGPQPSTGGSGASDAKPADHKPSDAEPADGELRARLAKLPTQLATWYGPGFYGRRTACGKVLRRSTRGVAHRRLPCGTQVTLYHRGRVTTVPVIDRGPYAKHISWDLTQATARSLGVRSTTRVRALH